MNPLDELKSLDRQIEQVTDLDALKPIFFRLDELAKQHSSDFEVQLVVGDVKQHVVNRGVKLKEMAAQGVKPIHESTQQEGLEQPVYYWDPVISPSGMTIYSGDLIPEWKGNFFIGGLSAKALVRLVLENDRVVGEERLLMDRDARIRDVVQGPEGALYLLTDEDDGELLKLTPRRAG